MNLDLVQSLKIVVDAWWRIYVYAITWRTTDIGSFLKFELKIKNEIHLEIHIMMTSISSGINVVNHERIFYSRT